METRIKIAGIVKESIVDGPGIRLVVFTQAAFTIVKAATIQKPTPLVMDIIWK